MKTLESRVEKSLLYSARKFNEQPLALRMCFWSVRVGGRCAFCQVAPVEEAEARQRAFDGEAGSKRNSGTNVEWHPSEISV